MTLWPVVLVLCAGGLKGVQGAEKASPLPQAAQEALAKDGFTVVEGREKHFFSLYDRNAYEKVPSFISADVVLHVFHARFDEELATLESNKLAAALQTFSSGQLARALAQFSRPGGPDEALLSLALFHAVAVALLDENAPIDSRLTAFVTADVKALRAGKGTLTSKACPVPLDASLFVPRGHSEQFALRGFFLASTWYAQCVFPLDRKGLPGAAAVVRLIDPPAAAALHELEALREFIAGPADDPGVSALRPLLTDAPLDELLARVAKLPKGRVASLRGPVFALLGGARTLEGEVLGRVGNQRTPSALDVLAALGSPSALRFLGRAPAAPSVPLGAGFSGRWLEVLSLLLNAGPETQPPYAKASAWEGRVLTAAAGSWAELKHDTLLYVKQPVVMREGGDEAELPASKVGGFVDPRPDVYRALLSLHDAMRTLAPSSDDAPGDFLRFVIEVSELELASKPFPKAMDERLRTIGGELEHLARTRGDRTPPQALVADVLTVEFPDKPREILHVGVGDVDELWVVVPRAGKQVLMRGGAFSYYEFTRPTRLTDQDFEGELRSATPPSRPLWARPVARAARKLHRD